MIGGCRRMPGVHTLFPQPQAVSSVLELQKGKVRCPLMVVSRCPPIRLRNMLALGGSVSATRLWWAIRTKPLHTDPHRFLKPSPIVRVSAFRSNSSRFRGSSSLREVCSQISYLSVQIWTSPTIRTSALGLSTSYFNNAGLCAR